MSMLSVDSILYSKLLIILSRALNNSLLAISSVAQITLTLLTSQPLIPTTQTNFILLPLSQFLEFAPDFIKTRAETIIPTRVRIYPIFIFYAKQHFLKLFQVEGVDLGLDFINRFFKVYHTAACPPINSNLRSIGNYSQ